MIYEWGSRTFSVDAQAVGETVERLSKEHGVCRPGMLVEEARPESSELHPLFTWDDLKAADNWRTHEARKVINTLVIVSEETEARPAGFIHVKVERGGESNEGYRPFYDVVSDDDQREQALREARRALNGFRRRYRHLQELQPVFDAIDEVAA